MTVGGYWWKFKPRLLEFERDLPGVYELGDKDEAVIYIGGSNAVRQRLLERLQSADPRVRDNATLYRIEYCADFERREREVYQRYVAQHGKPPRCNTELSQAFEESAP